MFLELQCMSTHYGEHLSHSCEKPARVYSYVLLQPATAVPTGNHDKTLLSRPKWPQIASAGFVGNKFHLLPSISKAQISREEKWVRWELQGCSHMREWKILVIEEQSWSASLCGFCFASWEHVKKTFIYGFNKMISFAFIYPYKILTDEHLSPWWHTLLHFLHKGFYKTAVVEIQREQRLNSSRPRVIWMLII